MNIKPKEILLGMSAVFVIMFIFVLTAAAVGFWVGMAVKTAKFFIG